MIKEKVSQYEKQAQEFLSRTGTTFQAVKLGHFPYFEDDKEPRDVYQITLTRGKQVYSFKFGQSIAKSETYIKKQQEEARRLGEYMRAIRFKIETPTAYDVLAAITKYDPGTFSDFCSEFRYNIDSRKAEKIYFAVQEEYKNITRLFSDVMAELEEIN